MHWFTVWAGGRQPQINTVPVLDLAEHPLPPLRIMLCAFLSLEFTIMLMQNSFAPLDLPTEANTPGLLWLFKHYSLPTAFLSERLQSVANSFGALNDIDGYNCM